MSKGLVMRAWRQKNRERLRERKKEYERTHREQTLAMKRREYWRHRERYVEQSRASYRKNKEERLRYSREYVARNREKTLRYMTEWHMRRWYRLAISDYDRMLESQNGRCAICGTTVPGRGRKRFCIDHDHVAGKVRGLLCMACNIGIGMFCDDIEKTEAALAYLKKHQQVCGGV